MIIIRRQAVSWAGIAQVWGLSLALALRLINHVDQADRFPDSVEGIQQIVLVLAGLLSK